MRSTSDDSLRQIPRSKEEQLARLTVLYDSIRRGFAVLGWAEGYRGSGDKEQFEVRVTVSAKTFRSAYDMLFPDGATSQPGLGRSDRPHRRERR